MKKLFLALCSAALLFAGCKKENEEPVAPRLSVSAETMAFEAKPNGPQTLTVTANTPWSATVQQDEDWMSITPASGTGNETITITAKENGAITAREATITLTASGVTAAVKVTQAPVDYLMTFDWTADAAEKQFTVRATAGKKFSVNWGDGTSDNYEGKGGNGTISDMRLSHTYNTAGSYSVVIGTVDSDCEVTYLSLPNLKINSLDVSKNTALKELDCAANQLKALDVSKNTALTELRCIDNQLEALDVTKNTALKYLFCNYNPLGALDVSKNTALTELGCHSNQLEALDVSKNTALTYLACSSNQLTELDITKNTKLTYLYCYSNKLTELDVTKNTKLTYLYCYSNKLTALDVSKNTALATLHCYSNQLTALDVSKNTALATLHCYSNQLTALDIRPLTKLDFTKVLVGNHKNAQGADAALTLTLTPAQKTSWNTSAASKTDNARVTLDVQN